MYENSTSLPPMPWQGMSPASGSAAMSNLMSSPSPSPVLGSPSPVGSPSPSPVGSPSPSPVLGSPSPVGSPSPSPSPVCSADSLVSVVLADSELASDPRS